MGAMNEASILIEEMATWTTDALVVAWSSSIDPVERYAAQHLVRARAADYIDLQQELQDYGKTNPDKMKRI